MADVFTIQEEQAAFDKQIQTLMPGHGGEFALVKSGEAVDFFPSYDDAYNAGLVAYGLSCFLVAQIVEQAPEAISLSWSAGVMLG